MSRQITVLHLLLTMNIGGAERVAASIVKGSDSRCFQHEVCCLDEVGVFGVELGERGVPTILLKRKTSGVDWLLIPRLAALLRRRNVDVLHTHGETPWFYGALACALTLGRTKCITTVHGYGGGDRTSLPHYRLWKVLTLLCDKVVLVAENLRKELVAQNLSGKRLITIRNGIDVDTVAAAGKEPRQFWGIQDSDLVIGIIARLTPVKNHRLLIKSLEELVNRGIRARAVIVGDGPEHESLRELAKELRVIEQVTFCGGQASCLKFFGMFDIFVLPSLSEGISMTVLEALACRVPVIASRVGGNIEIIDHDRNGILFQSEDLTALTEAILDLVANPSKRERLAASGAATVSENFSFRSMIDSYHRLYNELKLGGQ